MSSAVLSFNIRVYIHENVINFMCGLQHGFSCTKVLFFEALYNIERSDSSVEIERGVNFGFHVKWNVAKVCYLFL